MAWTDSCKVEACAQIKKKAENSSVRDAIKRLSDESGIPIGTLSRWYWPESDYKAEAATRNGSTQSTLIKQYETEQKEIEKDSEVQVLQQASEVRQAKKKKQEKVNSAIGIREHTLCLIHMNGILFRW